MKQIVDFIRQRYLFTCIKCVRKRCTKSNITEERLSITGVKTLWNWEIRIL